LTISDREKKGEKELVEKQTDLSILKKRQIQSAILNSCFSAIDCFVEDK
jgi:hypothetical protein